MMPGEVLLEGERFSTNGATSAQLFTRVGRKMLIEMGWTLESFVAEVAVRPALLHLRLLLSAQVDEVMTGQMCFRGELHFADGAVVLLPTFVGIHVVGKMFTMKEDFLAVRIPGVEN